MITMTDAEVLELLQDFLNTSKSHIEALAEVSAGWQARVEAAEAENARLREQVATLRYALNTVINAERGITQYHIDLALNALQETA